MEKIVKNLSAIVRRVKNFDEMYNLFISIFLLSIIGGVIVLIAALIASSIAAPFAKKIYVTAFILQTIGFTGCAKSFFEGVTDNWSKITIWNKCRRIAGGIIYSGFVFVFGAGAINYFKEIPTVIEFGGYVFLAIVLSAALFLAVSVLQFIVYLFKSLYKRLSAQRRLVCALNSVLDELSSAEK